VPKLKTYFIAIGLLIMACARADLSLVVQLVPGTNVVEYANYHRVDVLDTTDPAPFALLNISERDIVPTLIRIQADPRTVWMEPETKVEIPSQRTTSRGGTVGAVGDRSSLHSLNSNMLNQINWNSAVATGGTRPVRVAVLDTGIPFRSPQLWPKVVAGLNLVEPGAQPIDVPNFRDDNNNGQIDEGVGHGSMVAGIIDQIAPNASLIIVRLADSDGDSNSWFIIKGIVFSVLNGAEVINISMGTQGHLFALSNVVKWAFDQNVTIVAPIGIDNAPTVLKPASYDRVVCVTGVNHLDLKASFSNWNARADASAPATGIRSYWWDGTMGIWSGTSFAAPMMAGSIAVGLQYRTPAPLWKVRSAIQTSGTNIDGLNTGYQGMLGGRLNVVNLVNQLTLVPELSNLVFEPWQIFSGQVARGTVLLNAPVETDTVISLSSTHPMIRPPSQLMIRAGSNRGEFTIMSPATTQDISVDVRAMLRDQVISSRLLIRGYQP
jgi:hypothetical protein